MTTAFLNRKKSVSDSQRDTSTVGVKMSCASSTSAAYIALNCHGVGTTPWIMGFKQRRLDPCIYVSSTGKYSLIGVCVHDIVLAENNKASLQKVKPGY